METLSQQFVRTNVDTVVRFDLVRDTDGTFNVLRFESWRDSEFSQVHMSGSTWTNETQARALLLDLRLNTVDFTTL